MEYHVRQSPAVPLLFCDTNNYILKISTNSYIFLQSSIWSFGICYLTMHDAHNLKLTNYDFMEIKYWHSIKDWSFPRNVQYLYRVLFIIQCMEGKTRSLKTFIFRYIFYSNICNLKNYFWKRNYKMKIGLHHSKKNCLKPAMLD